jgi:hypothetical protein
MRTLKALHIVNTSAKFAYYQNKNPFYNKVNAYQIKGIVLGIMQKYYGVRPKGYRSFPIGYGLFFKIKGYEFHTLTLNKPRNLRQLNSKKYITPWAFYRMKDVVKSYVWLQRFIERHDYLFFSPTETLPHLGSYQWKLNSQNAYKNYFEYAHVRDKYRGLVDYEREIKKLHPQLAIKG